MPEMWDPFCPSFIQPCSQHGTNPLAAITKGENGYHSFTLTTVTHTHTHTMQCYNMTVAAMASPVSEIRILKGKRTKGASWPGTHKLCKIFVTARFIWLFYCYPYKRSAFLLHTVELLRAQPSWLTFHQWRAEKGQPMTYLLLWPHKLTCLQHHYCRLLGTKWQHSWLCFQLLSVEYKKTQDEKPREKLLLCESFNFNILISFIAVNWAPDASLVHFPWSHQQSCCHRTLSNVVGQLTFCRLVPVRLIVACCLALCNNSHMQPEEIIVSVILQMNTVLYVNTHSKTMGKSQC